MRWPWTPRDEPQGEDVSENYRDETDDEQQDFLELGEGEGDEEEPELDEAQRAYVERQAQAREAALLEKVRTSLQAQGLDYTGDGAAIRDVNTFANKFGFGGQQQEQPRQPVAPAAAADPYEALGERPDPLYDEEGARKWDREYRAAIKAEAMAEMAPQLQQLQGMLAQTQVASATDRVKALFEKQGFGAVVEHPDFAGEFGQAILQQPMETWDDPAVLAGIAGWVIPRLKPVERQPQRPRDDAGRYTADEANQRSLRQVSAPRESGRPAAGPAQGMDATTRALAASQGMTPEEWLHYKELGPERSEAEHDDWVRRRTRSARR